MAGPALIGLLVVDFVGIRTAIRGRVEQTRHRGLAELWQLQE
jgi:hypothetical protein